jgi:hypothetical protein
MLWRERICELSVCAVSSFPRSHRCDDPDGPGWGDSSLCWMSIGSSGTAGFSWCIFPRGVFDPSDDMLGECIGFDILDPVEVPPCLSMLSHKLAAWINIVNSDSWVKSLLKSVLYNSALGNAEFSWITWWICCVLNYASVFCGSDMLMRWLDIFSGTPAPQFWDESSWMRGSELVHGWGGSCVAFWLVSLRRSVACTNTLMGKAVGVKWQRHVALWTLCEQQSKSRTHTRTVTCFRYFLQWTVNGYFQQVFF